MLIYVQLLMMKIMLIHGAVAYGMWSCWNWTCESRCLVSSSSSASSALDRMTLACLHLSWL